MPYHERGRFLRLMGCVLVGLIAFTLISAPGAWARPGMQPGFQTVPTLPPIHPPATPTPTEVPVIPTPTGEPTARPTPTRGPSASTTPPPAEQPTPTPIQLSPDLRAQFRAEPTAAAPGQRVTYLLVVRNVGAAPSGPLAFRMELPPALLLEDVLFDPGGTYTLEGYTLRGEIPSIAAGAEARLEIRVQVKADTAAGSIIQVAVELSFAGGVWRSPVAAVALPPAELPPTGGVRPSP